MAAYRKRIPLSSVDAAWLRMEDPTNLMMVTGVLMFDQPLDYERLKATLEQRLLRFDRFRQRVVQPKGRLGSPQWESDPHFDLNAHLHRIALPAPGDQAALQELVSDLMGMPLDFSKPLWQMHLIENFNGGSALFARLHHAIGDGIALVHVLLSLTDSEPNAPWPSPEPRKKRGVSSNPFGSLLRPVAAVRSSLRITEKLWREGREVLNNPEYARELGQKGASGAAALGKLLLIGPDPKTVFKGKLGVAKRAAWSTPIPLADVKTVGRMTGATVNDVLLAVVTGALRSYMVARGELVDGIEIRAVVPVNLRPLAEEPELGNRFGLVFLSLPVGVDDLIDRLFDVKKRMEEIKGSAEAVVAFGILNAIGMAPAEIEKLVVTIFGLKATAVMTNVPGPRETVYLAGAPIRGIMFWVPQSGHLGLGVSILSYAGQVTLGLATDAGLVPDPETIIAGFHAEFEELVELARVIKKYEGESKQVKKERR